MKCSNLIYKPKALIPGYKIEEGLEGLYAAIPDKSYKGHKFSIIYYYPLINDRGERVYGCIEKQVEDWNKACRFRRFMDQWGRGSYTLGYFKMADKL